MSTYANENDSKYTSMHSIGSGDEQDRSSNDSWSPKIKPRRRFSSEETRLLESAFAQQPNPLQEVIQRLADQLGTPKRTITTWFQNRRAKQRRKEYPKTRRPMESTRHGDSSLAEPPTLRLEESQPFLLQDHAQTVPLMLDDQLSDFVQSLWLPPPETEATTFDPYTTCPTLNTEPHWDFTLNSTCCGHPMTHSYNHVDACQLGTGSMGYVKTDNNHPLPLLPSFDHTSMPASFYSPTFQYTASPIPETTRTTSREQI